MNAVEQASLQKLPSRVEAGHPVAATNVCFLGVSRHQMLRRTSPISATFGHQRGSSLHLGKRNVYPLVMVEIREGERTLKTSSVSDWFQIVASIGVLAGLLLVGYELNRNEGINIGNLSYQSLENLQNYNLVVVGESPMASLTKACLSPEGLSEEDYFVLDALYSFRTADIRKLEILRLRGDYDISDSIDGVARHHASEIASTIAGRAWLEANMSEIPAGMQPHAEAELKNPTKNCHATMSGFISRTQQMSDRTPDE